jgi:hypothetical protein
MKLMQKGRIKPKSYPSHIKIQERGAFIVIRRGLFVIKFNPVFTAPGGFCILLTMQKYEIFGYLHNPNRMFGLGRMFVVLRYLREQAEAADKELWCRLLCRLCKNLL